MANTQMYGDGGAPSGGDAGAVSVLFNWAGALMSVALVAGLGMWGYQLAMRDVTGVPVVRALEGPMRIAPDDPGGVQAAHQGLAVNSVAADGGTAAPADRLVLAPAPLDLTDEDQPRPRLAEAPVQENTVPAAPTREELLAMAEELTDGVTPLAAQLELTDVVPTSVPGVKRSPLPVARPLGDLTAQAVANMVAGSVAGANTEVSAASVPAGTRLVQFGAYDSPDIARAEWQKLEAGFADFMRGKQRIVQEAVSGGKTFYRLRAMGFADISDARRFCSALLAQRQACIPVVVR